MFTTRYCHRVSPSGEMRVGGDGRGFGATSHHKRVEAQQRRTSEAAFLRCWPFCSLDIDLQIQCRGAGGRASQCDADGVTSSRRCGCSGRGAGAAATGESAQAYQ